MANTVSFDDLDQSTEMIIFESILTTFKASVVFEGFCSSDKNWLKPKNEPTFTNLACPNPWYTLYKVENGRGILKMCKHNVCLKLAVRSGTDKFNVSGYTTRVNNSNPEM